MCAGKKLETSLRESERKRETEREREKRGREKADTSLTYSSEKNPTNYPC